MVYKSLAAILFSLGAFSLITAGTLPAMADPACNGSVIEPGMECEAAHAVNREEAADIDLTCLSNGTICYQPLGSECGDVSGFQLAVQGACVVTWETSNDDSCEEDTYSTFVPLEHYITDCMFHEMNCQCMFLKSNDHPTQYSEVCDCSDL
ncbi:hypothetical protein N9153_01005 [Planctomicrobium sp.]|nr:hypothetical protein [Planctomicrobium sp.]